MVTTAALRWPIASKRADDAAVAVTNPSTAVVAALRTVFRARGEWFRSNTREKEDTRQTPNVVLVSTAVHTFEKALQMGNGEN